MLTLLFWAGAGAGPTPPTPPVPPPTPAPPYPGPGALNEGQGARGGYLVPTQMLGITARWGEATDLSFPTSPDSPLYSWIDEEARREAEEFERRKREWLQQQLNKQEELRQDVRRWKYEQKRLKDEAEEAELMELLAIVD